MESQGVASGQLPKDGIHLLSEQAEPQEQTGQGEQSQWQSGTVAQRNTVLSRQFEDRLPGGRGS